MALAGRGVSGIAAILPFTCMPGTLIASVSESIRKDHNNIPFINIAYDGQDSVSLDTRLQAFVFQVFEYSGINRDLKQPYTQKPSRSSLDAVPAEELSNSTQ
jgi:predicted nucleotide-binding protein (sugar kinase/HSP70/actin superfamily)